MGDSQGIIGFTEAELGFFLALLCIVLWVASMPAAAETSRVEIRADSLARLQTSAKSAAALRKKVDSVTSALATTNRVVDSLRSRLLPHCAAVGKATGPIATVEVYSDRKLVMDGQSMTMDELRTRTDALRKPVEGVCMQQIVVRFADGLSARESEAVRSQLNGMHLRIVSGSFISAPQ